jgi:hypothetical protein
MKFLKLTQFALFSGISPAAVSAQLRGPAVENIERVAAYEEAHNADDVEKAMAMFAREAVVEMVGQGTLSDLEAIRAIHEYDRSISARLRFENCTAEGLTVACEVREQNEWLNAAGLGEIFYPSSVFTFNGAGEIQKITATISPEDGAAMGAVLAEFIPWLLDERPSKSTRLFTPERQFIYSEANGNLVGDLLSEWQAGR